MTNRERILQFLHLILEFSDGFKRMVDITTDKELENLFKGQFNKHVNRTIIHLISLHMIMHELDPNDFLPVDSRILMTDEELEEYLISEWDSLLIDPSFYN